MISHLDWMKRNQKKFGIKGAKRPQPDQISTIPAKNPADFTPVPKKSDPKITTEGTQKSLDQFCTPSSVLFDKGFTIEEVFAKRSVNSRADRRGKVSEALIRNF